MESFHRSSQQFVVVVPAAGIGKRMMANCPKQYLTINGETILSLTVNRLLSHPQVDKVILSLSKADSHFANIALIQNKNVITVDGGKERVDSVLNGLQSVDSTKYPWVLVHDAARPCVTHDDIDALIDECLLHNSGGLLAAPVRDTMKRGKQVGELSQVRNTVEREQLWHALTPQLYKTDELILAINKAQQDGVDITDESSAIEHANFSSLLVFGSSENIKITRPDDLALAEFFLEKQSLNKRENKCV